MNTNIIFFTVLVLLFLGSGSYGIYAAVSLSKDLEDKIVYSIWAGLNGIMVIILGWILWDGIRQEVMIVNRSQSQV
jgi:multidrug transporter EmrE-like cation transporter